MPTDGICSGRLVGHRRQTVADEEAKQTEHDAEPGHIDGGIGVERRDPRQRLAEWPQQRETEPSPTSSSSGPRTRSPESRTAAPARSSSTAGMPKRR